MKTTIYHHIPLREGPLSHCRHGCWKHFNIPRVLVVITSDPFMELRIQLLRCIVLFASGVPGAVRTAFDPQTQKPWRLSNQGCRMSASQKMSFQTRASSEVRHDWAITSPGLILHKDPAILTASSVQKRSPSRTSTRGELHRPYMYLLDILSYCLCGLTLPFRLPHLTPNLKRPSTQVHCWVEPQPKTAAEPRRANRAPPPRRHAWVSSWRSTSSFQ